MAVSEVLISTLGALAGAGVGGYASYKATGPYWERAKLSATAPLVEARIRAYDDLWKLTDYGTEEEPYAWDRDKRMRRAEELRAWYYENAAGSAAGLLLSDAARRQWQTARETLAEPNPRDEDIRQAMTCLRTRLKQDVHVHDLNIDESQCLGQRRWRPSKAR